VDYWTLLADGIVIGAIAAGFCIGYCLLVERADRRRARLRREP
jgi:hypothetical protein